MAYNLGTAQGQIQFSYDSSGVLRARNHLGQFVSLANAMGNDVDRSTDRANRGFGKLGGALTSVIKYAVIGAAAINALVNGLGAIVAVAQTLAPVIAAGLATLPGVILAAGAAAVVLKAALAGVGDAVKLAFSDKATDVKKFEEALKKLAPSAREAVLAVRELVPGLKSVQQSIQDAFFAGTAPLIRDMADSIGELRNNAAGTSAAMGGIFQELLKAGSSSTVIAAIAQSLNGVRDLLNSIRPAILPLVEGFAALAGQAGVFGGALGDSLRQALTSFGTFLQGINLQSLFDAAAPILTALGSLFSNLGSIAASVFGALSSNGANALGVLGSLVAQLAAFLRTAEGTAALQALGQALGAIASGFGVAFLALLQAIAPALVALAPVVGQLATVLGANLAAAFTALAPLLMGVVQALSGALLPLLPVLAQHTAAILPLVTQLATMLGTHLSTAFTILGPLIAQVAAVFSQVLVQALTAILPVIGSLLPVFAQLAASVLPALIPIIISLGRVLISLAPLLAMVGQLIAAVLVPAVQLLTPLITLVATVLATLIGWLATAIVWIVKIVTAFLQWTQIVAFVSGIVKAIAGFFQWLFQLLIGGSIVPDLVNGVIRYFQLLLSVGAAIFNALRSVLAAIWNGILATAQAIWNTFQNVIQAAWNAAVALVRAGINSVKASIALLAAIPGQVAGFLNSMVSAFRNGVSNAVSTVRELPGRIAGALGGLGSLLVGAGRDAIQGLINGIGSMAGAVMDKARSIANSVKNAIAGALKIGSPSKIMMDMGLDVGAGLVLGIDKSLRDAVAAADRLAQSVIAGMPTDFSANVRAAVSASSLNGIPVPAGTQATQPAVGPSVNVGPIYAPQNMNEREVGDLVARRVLLAMG